jgi:hypothetical protein
MKTFSRILTAVLAVAALQGPAHADKLKVRQDLAATPAGADARGRARLVLVSASNGKFEVIVQRLDPDATYQLIVGGVHVADIVTSGGGNGRARFRTQPRSSRDLPLGFDPRGATLVVRSATGDDVLASAFPEEPADGKVVCCIPDDEGAECEDRTADECAAAGGTVPAGATSCLPNPCEGAPPVAEEIVCCVPDDGGAECEDRTQNECLAEGGMVVDATSCTPDPCAATPPAGGEIVCCLPDSGGDGENECEDLTADACTTAGGMVSDATSCSPDPCNVTPPAAEEIACCVPGSTEGAECEMLTTDDCTAQGGSPASAATCDPDPCGGSHDGGGSSGPH